MGPDVPGPPNTAEIILTPSNFRHRLEEGVVVRSKSKLGFRSGRFWTKCSVFRRCSRHSRTPLVSSNAASLAFSARNIAMISCALISMAHREVLLFGSTECSFHGAHERWMQGPGFWCLTMWCNWRNREPFGRVRQIKHLSQIELGVVAQARRRVGRGVSVTDDGELAAMQRLVRWLVPYATRTSNCGALSSNTAMTKAGRGFGRGWIRSGKWRHTISPAVGSPHHCRVTQFLFQTNSSERSVCRLVEYAS